MSNEFSGTTGWIFTNLYGIERAMSGLDKFCIYLAIAQGTLPWQHIKLTKSAFLLTNLHCHTVVPKQFGISERQWQLRSALNMATSCTKLVSFGAVTPEKLLLNFGL